MSVTVTLLLLAASVNAAPTDSKTGSEATAAEPAKPKKICRPGAATGSRMTGKICKTQAEWDAMPGADANKLKRSSGGY